MQCLPLCSHQPPSQMALEMSRTDKQYLARTRSIFPSTRGCIPSFSMDLCVSELAQGIHVGTRGTWDEISLEKGTVKEAMNSTASPMSLSLHVLLH